MLSPRKFFPKSIGELNSTTIQAATLTRVHGRKQTQREWAVTAVKDMDSQRFGSHLCHLKPDVGLHQLARPRLDQVRAATTTCTAIHTTTYSSTVSLYAFSVDSLGLKALSYHY